ncbi:hypothetical protein BC941DRAFT_409223, partial [Chlamydoabsidia padenii]
MQLKLVTLLGFYILQINAASIIKRSPDSVSLDYHANKDYVPFQRLDKDLRLATEEEEEEPSKMPSDVPTPQEEEEKKEEQTGTQKKYGVTTVGSRQYRYRDSTGTTNPVLMVPLKPLEEEDSNSKQALPRKKQKNLIGVDDKGHVRHVVLDSNKDEKDDPRRKSLGQKHVLAVDEQGEQHTIALPMTLVSGS